jgi:hypothetical protein
MSIKKPNMIKPNIKKPNVAGLKKPAAAPVKPTVAEEVVEEKVIEIPVIYDPPVEEVADQVVQKELEEEVEQENQALEEQDALNEVVVEEKPKKKASKKASKKKEEPKAKVEIEQEVEENLPQMSLSNATEKMEANINITLPEWEETKEEIQDKLKALTIDPDVNPAGMRMLIGEIDDLLTELRLIRTKIDEQSKALNEQVEYIRLSNSKGSNSEERKASGYKALMNYKKNPDDEEVINLVEYQIFMNNKLNFLNESIEIVKDKKQLLITFSSMLKIESTF